MSTRSKSEAIYTTLSERILRWEYLPAHRFTEAELCREFGVSRSPVREALHRLAEGGLVEGRPHLGYTVRLLAPRAVSELYDVRLALEELVVTRLCAQASHEAWLRAAEARWKDLLEHVPRSSAEVAEADEAFHLELAALAGNRELVAYLQDVSRRIHFVRLADIDNPERVRQTCREHLALLVALRVRDPRRALACLRTNIEGGRAKVERATREALARAYQRETA